MLRDSFGGEICINRRSQILIGRGKLFLLERVLNFWAIGFQHIKFFRAVYLG